MEGGIIKYLEKVENKSAWYGECFVFDNRVSVDRKLKKGSYKICYACRMPLSKDDINNEKYIKGVSCHKCYGKKSQTQINKYQMRNKQLENISVDARDIATEIQINFDVTGNSVTEGKMKDMTAYFGSRLKQIREMMISHNVLPRLPIRNSHAWKGRNRYNSQEYEITLVGLASEVKWTRTGKLRFTVEDEAAEIDCILPIPSDAEPKL